MKYKLVVFFLVWFSLLSCSDCETPSGINVQNTPSSQENKIIGFNQNWSMMPSLSVPLLNNMKLLKPGVIRYPGGTVTHNWDWRQGVKKDIKGNNVHLIQDVKTLHDALQCKVVVVLDILNSTLSDQIQMLSSLQLIGIPIEYIELGNELYAQEKSYVEIFPTGAEYAARVAEWVPALRRKFPDAKFAALLQCRDMNIRNDRMNHWNDLVVKGTFSLVDAYTYHVYIPLGGTFDSRIQDFNVVVKAAATGNKPLWITEYGNQNSNSTDNYYSDLNKLADYLESFSKISLLLNHQIIGGNKCKLNDTLSFTKEGEMFLNRVTGK